MEEAEGGVCTKETAAVKEVACTERAAERGWGTSGMDMRARETAVGGGAHLSFGAVRLA